MNNMTIGDFLDALRSEFNNVPAAGGLPDFIGTDTQVSVQKEPMDEPDVRYKAVTTCSYTIVGNLKGKFVIKVYANGKLSVE